MKKLFLKSTSIVCCMIISFQLCAQYQLTGTVKDRADGSPVPFSTAALFHPDSSLVTGAMTDNEGKFLLEKVTAGDFLLQISFLGYEKEYIKVKIPEQSDLGEILLSESANKLNEVVVTAKRSFVEQRVDRYIVNVESHILTAGRNAIEVLNNTPGVLVSPQNEISVMGNSVNIYIDGRPSNLSGQQLIAMLSTTSGETIERIEVITNPSARYDASGGSIINFRLKKNMQHGLNGAINAGFRKSRTDRENTDINLNYRYGNLNVFGNYSLERRNEWARMDQTNNTVVDGTNYIFQQNATKKPEKANFAQQYKLGADFLINDKHTLGAFVTGYHTDETKTGLRSSTDITPSLDNVSRTTSDSRVSDGDNGIQVNMNYQGTFAKPGQQLNIDVDFGQFKTIASQYNTNEYFDVDNNKINGQEQLRHNNPPKVNMWSAKIDYIQPLRQNARIEFGVKSSRSQTDNNLLYERFTDTDWLVDTDRSNHFSYTEQIHAAYVNYSQSFGKLNFQAGLRGEYSISKGEQKTTSEANDSTYLDIFPSLNISYHYSDNQQFAFAYGRRIFRPSYAQLNPFEIALDAYSFTSGNPHLKPVIMDNISLTSMNNKGLMVRAAYSVTHNAIDNIPVQDNGRYGMRLENFERRDAISLMANYRKQVTRFYMFNIAVESAYVKNTSNEPDGKKFTNDGFMLQAQFANRFTITPTLNLELTMLYVSAQKQNYMNVKPLSLVSGGISKSLLKGRLAVSLTANDIFGMFIYDMKSQNEGTNYHLKLNKDSQWVNLSVRYNFGSSSVKGSRNHSSGMVDEVSRAQK